MMGATRFDGQCELVKQASLATCELGRSFGCEQQHMWVANCRGVFSCAGHRVRCGYPPGRPAYNCSCTLPPSPRTWRPEPVLDAASVSAALAASGPSPHVWLDIGISSETLAKWDIMHDSRLIVAGIDALEANVKDAKHPASPRFIRVHGASACEEDGAARGRLGAPRAAAGRQAAAAQRPRPAEHDGVSSPGVDGLMCVGMWDCDGARKGVLVGDSLRLLASRHG